MGGLGYPSTTGDIVASRFGTSADFVRNLNIVTTQSLPTLATSNFSVPVDDADISHSSLTPVAVGDPPSPTAVPEYTSQMQAVALADLEALRKLLGMVDVTISQVALPSLAAIEPGVVIPDAPDDILPKVPEDVPAVADPNIPNAPTLDMPAVPVLEEISLPAAPVLESLTFGGTLPTANLTAPEPMFVYNEGTYQSDLADAVRTRLYNDVIAGGTGLGATIEQDIWDRALSRLNIELSKIYTQVLNNWAAWNCEMPDGTLSGSLLEVMFEDSRNRLDQNRDIAVEQARLAQQNTQFAITNGMVYEKQLMDFTNQVNQRAFEVARYRVQAVIDAFNLKVSSFNARMEGYKVQAQVFESLIRAELAKIEAYKAQMEGAKILGDLQVQKVQIYTARVNALQVVIDLYRAQMEGAKLQTDIDKARIDAFRARIEAVVAQIGGVTAKYNLYQARIAGETAKVELFGKQVDAFATQVQATKVTADINLAEMQARVEGNKDKVAILTAALEKYKADAAYEAGKEDAYARGYTAQASRYAAEVDREGEYLRAKVETFKAQVNEVIGRAELAVKEMDARLQAATASKEMQLEAMKTTALINAQLAAAAMTSTSVSTQMGFNESLSSSNSTSSSESSSHNNSNVVEISTQTVDQTVHQG